jgi:SRSO17 transposase
LYISVNVWHQWRSSDGGEDATDDCDPELTAAWAAEYEAPDARLAPHVYRAQLRAHVLERLGHQDAVLVVDETGFLKKVTASVGVTRQDSGTAGKTDNCQLGVVLAFAAARGQAFLDRELYLPTEWADDPGRRAEAGVPETVAFATKPELAQRMLARALDGGVEAAWVVADAVYGDSRWLGMELEARAQPSVLAPSGKAHVWAGLQQQRAGDVRAALRDTPGDE